MILSLKPKNNFSLKTLFTILLATAINYAASRLAGFISFPLYLDSISTFFVAATCGLVPALIVASLSNLLLAIFATTALPFLLCHLMTAVFAHLVFRRGTSAPHFLIAGLFSALSNTALGSTFSLVLFSGNTTIATVDNAVQGIFLATNNLPFAVYWGGTLTNLIDKSLSSFVSFLVFRIFEGESFPRYEFASANSVRSRSDRPPLSPRASALKPSATHHHKIFPLASLQSKLELTAEPIFNQKSSKRGQHFPIKSTLFAIAIINLIATLYFSSRAENQFSYFEDLAYKLIYSNEKIDIQKDFNAFAYFNDAYKTTAPDTLLSILRSDITRLRFGFSCMNYASILLIILILFLTYSESQTQKNINRSLEIKKEEQLKLSENLHDSALQSLLGVRILIENGKIQQAQKMCDKTMVDLRFLCGSLRDDYSKNFEDLLKNRLALFMNNFDIKCELYSASEICKTFSEATKENLLFAVNEILSNAAHHAAATLVTVRMIDSGQTFVLRIADNGKNFHAQITEKSGHYGIKNIRSRVAKCGGSVEWIATKSGGCEVVVRI